MKKQTIKIIEKSYALVNECGDEKEVPYLGLNKINLSDFFCDSREEQLFKKSGQLLEHRTYKGDYELSTMKVLVYDENDLIVKEIDICIIPDSNDIGTDYQEYTYENGRKVKNFFHQADSERVNDGYIEYVYSNDYSKIIDTSQPDNSYHKLRESNSIQITEEWITNNGQSILERGVLEERNTKNEVVFHAIFDDKYHIPSQKGYKNYFKDGYHIVEWSTGRQVNYRKYDVHNNLVEEKTSHTESLNYSRLLHSYNKFNDEIQLECQSYSTEDFDGNYISEKPINVYTYNGGRPETVDYHYLYDEQNNWVKKITVRDNIIVSVTERELKYY